MANNHDDMDSEFGQLVDELKQEVGCIATFFTPEELRAMVNAMKSTGPALTGDRYKTLAADALQKNDTAAGIGFLFMAICTDAIAREAEQLEAGGDTPLDDYNPVERPLFGKRRSGPRPA